MGGFRCCAYRRRLCFGSCYLQVTGARGGAREGAGRKRTSPEGTLRKGRTLRASDSEWEIIKDFARVLKHDPERAARMMKTE